MRTVSGLVIVAAGAWLAACSGDGGDGSGKDPQTARIQAPQVSAYHHVSVAAATSLELLGPYATEGSGIDQRHGDKVRPAGCAPMPDGPPPRDQPSGLGPDDEGNVRTGVEGAVPSCAVFTWSGPLTATVTYTSCDVGGNGVIVDGTVTLWVTFLPTTVGLEFKELAVGANRFDGTLTALFAGAEASPTTTLVASLDLDLGEGATMVSLDGLSLVVDTAMGMTLDGPGSIESTGFSGSFDAHDTFYATGDCNPSSGEAELGLVGIPPMTAIFKATTPADGKVDARIGSVLIEDYPLLPPCE